MCVIIIIWIYLAVHYDLEIVSFLRKSYRVRNKMYSVGCENSACSIQSGIDPQPAVFFGISPLQLPRSWWRVSWSAVWNTSSTCCFAHALKVSVYLSKHICPTGNHKIVEPNFETNPVLLFFIYVFFLRGLLVVRLSPLIFLTTEKLWKVYQLIWINNSQFICCLETGCFVCAISGFVISHEILCSNVCDYKQPLQPWKLVKTLHIF